MTAEQILLARDGVKVTNSRFIVGGETYAMSGITSVSSVEVRPSRGRPMILCVFAVLATVAGLARSSGLEVAVGLLALGAGGFWLYGQSALYSVELRTAAGEVTALTSNSEQRIREVVDAVNEAIVSRG